MFDDYIEMHGQRLFGLCMHLCRERWDAQDLYQETWLKAYQAQQNYDSSRDFGMWLTSICVNLYRDKLRRKKLLSFLPFSPQEEEQSPVHQLAGARAGGLQRFAQCGGGSAGQISHGDCAVLLFRLRYCSDSGSATGSVRHGEVAAE